MSFLRFPRLLTSTTYVIPLYLPTGGVRDEELPARECDEFTGYMYGHGRNTPGYTALYGTRRPAYISA